MPTSYEIADFARYRREFFGKYIDLSNGLPADGEDERQGARAVALRTQVTTHFSC